MSVSSSTGIFILSLLAIPTCYIVNQAQALHGETGLFVSGTVSLIVICVLTYMLIGRKGQPSDPLFYGLAMCTFGSVASLLVGLAGENIVTSFMGRYLLEGEPYLATPYGTLVSLWDGTAHYLCLLYMLRSMGRGNQNFREVGLLWAGSIGHSMVVFMPGNVVGKFGIRPSFLLNIPYCFIPFFSAGRFLRDRPKETLPSAEVKECHTSIWKRPLDMFFILGLVVSMAIGFLRGFAVLGCRSEITATYLKTYEPYLTDDTTYPKMQMLVYLFYFMPYYVMAIYGLIYPGQSWMPDWSILHAGAALNAQIPHIGGAFHARTPYVLRVSRDPHIRTVFFLINIFLLVLPMLLAYRCSYQKLFMPAAEKEENGPARAKKVKGH